MLNYQRFGGKMKHKFHFDEFYQLIKQHTEQPLEGPSRQMNVPHILYSLINAYIYLFVCLYGV